MAKIVFKSVKKYSPSTSDKVFKKTFRDELINHSKQYFTIGNLAAGSSYYKYFPMGNAIKCLNNNTIAFVEPARWNDAYERLYYEADYSNVSSDYKMHPRVFATCATNKKYDEPAWKIYSGDEKICVQFEIDRVKLRYEILKSLDAGDSVYEGVVQYTTKDIIQNIGNRYFKDKDGKDRDNKNYCLFISRDDIPFCIDNYLNLLLLKRQDFEHEKETRFFIIKKEDIDNQTNKAKEITFEQSDSSGRKKYVNSGELKVLNDIKWANILKSITINVDKEHYAYSQLQETINQMIDRDITDETKKAELKKKLEPISYLVYGTTPPTITIDG